MDSSTVRLGDWCGTEDEFPVLSLNSPGSETKESWNALERERAKVLSSSTPSAPPALSSNNFLSLSLSSHDFSSAAPPKKPTNQPKCPVSLAISVVARVVVAVVVAVVVVVVTVHRRGMRSRASRKCLLAKIWLDRFSPSSSSSSHLPTPLDHLDLT